MASFTAFSRLEMGRCIMGSRQACTVRRGYLRAASHKPRQQAMELKLPDIDHVWIMCLNNCCFAQRAACVRGQTVHTPLADSWFDVRKEKKTVWRHVFICRTSLRDRLLSTQHHFYMFCLSISRYCILFQGTEWTCFCGCFWQQNILLVHAFKITFC